MAITSGVRNMQAVMDLVWAKLLPAFQPHSLPADAEGEHRLARKLASWQLPTAKGEELSPLASKFLGKRFVFEPNDEKLESASLVASPTGKIVQVMNLEASTTANK